jgi:hypothetical protein
MKNTSLLKTMIHTVKVKEQMERAEGIGGGLVERRSEVNLLFAEL